MTWVLVDDGFFEHPKTLAAGETAAYLFLAGLAYCNRLLTDGRIPKPAVRKLTTARHAGRLAAALVAVGYWQDRGDHYEVHDYLDYQESRETIEARRGRDRQRKRGRFRVDSTRNPDGRFAEASGNPDGLHVESAGTPPAPSHSHPTPIPSPPAPSAPPDPPVASLRSATSPRSRGSPGDGVCSGFARFWAEYPRRVGRRKALLAWQRLGLEAQADAVLAGLARVRPAWTDPAFIPHPTTWLNRAGWEDEPEPPRPTVAPRDRPTAGEAAAWISQHLGRDGEDVLRRHRDWLARPWPVWETALELSDQGVQMGLFVLLMDREATGDTARALAARYVQPR